MGWRDYMSACTFVCHVMLHAKFRAGFRDAMSRLCQLLATFFRVHARCRDRLARQRVVITAGLPCLLRRCVYSACEALRRECFPHFALLVSATERARALAALPPLCSRPPRSSAQFSRRE